MEYAVGIIADIVGSRELDDRPQAQQTLEAAFQLAQQHVPTVRAAWATVGDEFQLIVATWQDAVRITLRIQLALPENIQLRFGVGAGEIRTISHGASGPIQDGTAWIHAREALEHIEATQEKLDGVATAFRTENTELVTAVNAALLLRDHTVHKMKARERRLFAALLFGATQQEAARVEKISQAAVSQALHRSGAMTLLDIDDTLESTSSYETKAGA